MEIATGAAATAAPTTAAPDIFGRAAVIIAISAIITPAGAITVPAVIAAISGAINAGDKRTGQNQYRQ
ncbi:hypothetical protein Geu3261_0160_048 [Komagataeibacter europaeus NBRC 3261]|uniref:Uncharacterized protein n=2 Tax=Komagataeibacter europaeus TaxID=33995 RepID=A0A0D6Q208_KOMEU|nr:hypothetical protein Geu3261_0160_048 [Komagataeibacter europaeus NBRC 3261]